MDDIIEKLPKDFVEEMKNLLGSEYDEYEKSLKNNPVRGIRVNTKKISSQQFYSEFCKKYNYNLKKIQFCNDGYIFDADEKVGGYDEHLSGLIYMQEPSSMISVCASGIEDEKRPLKILDLCAAPGGKTGQIACRVSDDSVIFSNEIIKSRAEILYSNIERQGFQNIVVLNEQPCDLTCFKGYFDYVFVDAPCSGEGMFRKDPKTIDEWSKDNVLMCSQRQKDILEIAKSLVKLDGKLVYSTCTFSKEEDEDIVEWLVNDCGFELCDIPIEIKKQTRPSCANVKNSDYARKFFPFSGDGEGQFVAVLKNVSIDNKCELFFKKHYKSLVQIGQSENKLIKEFSTGSLNFEFSWQRLYRVGDNIFYAPKGFDGNEQTALENLKFISIGVKLGLIEKDRFVPNHFCFMALADLFEKKIELNDADLKKYFHGEELLFDGNKKGYGVVLRNGNAVGGVKIVGNRLKNLYPKGLRN